MKFDVLNVLSCWLVAVLIIFFSIDATGKKEQIEAARLQIKVLKLELQRLENPKHTYKYYTWEKGVGYVPVK